MLHERIGSGGMAEVYRATYSPEGGFEKQVALKRILPSYADDAEFVSLFRREAELCSTLHHPNIVQVFDLGHGNTYFLAMEFVDGLPLSTVLRGLNWQGLPLGAVAFLGAELAAALDYLHRRTGRFGEPLHLIHRDVNPPNVLISRIAGCGAGAAHRGGERAREAGVHGPGAGVREGDRWAGGPVRAGPHAARGAHRPPGAGGAGRGGVDAGRGGAGAGAPVG
jgi:serine/threonine protein kinase